MVCLVAALYTYGKRLMSGVPRKKSLVFHKIDDADEAGVELSSSYDEEQRNEQQSEQRNKQRNEDAFGEHKQDISSMRASVLTSMM